MYKILSAVVVLSTLSLPAAAQDQRCGPADVVRQMLEQKYHEVMIGQGATSDGQALLTIFANPDGSTWTAVITRAQDRVSCLAADGEQWQQEKPEAPKAPEPAL